jgi:hypothetical protein
VHCLLVTPSCAGCFSTTCRHQQQQMLVIHNHVYKNALHSVRALHACRPSCFGRPLLAVTQRHESWTTRPREQPAAVSTGNRVNYVHLCSRKSRHSSSAARPQAISPITSGGRLDKDDPAPGGAGCSPDIYNRDSPCASLLTRGKC